MENLDNKRASLEALLFIHGEPLSYKKIGTVLGIPPDELTPFIEEYRHELEASGRGLQLIADREKVQLATKPEFNQILEDFVKEEITEDLTSASLEALSVISYLGPISRAKLEYLRGVNSIIILRSLMIRGLIERFPDPEHPTGYLYQTSFDLLKHLGVKDKSELPEYEKFQELLKVFEQENGPTEQAASGVTAMPTPPIEPAS